MTNEYVVDLIMNIPSSVYDLVDRKLIDSVERSAVSRTHPGFFLILNQ